jgi:hypothetical protein
MMSTPGTMGIPHSHLCRHLGKVTKATSSQSASGGYSRQSGPNVWAGYLSLKFFKRTEDKWTGKTPRTPNGFGIHEAPRPNETSGFSRRTPNIHFFCYDWSSFGGVISVSLLHVTSCLAPVLEGVLGYAYMTTGFDHSLVLYNLFSNLGQFSHFP